MKKWQKTAMSLGLASTMLVPSFASASTTLNNAQDFKANQPYNVLNQLDLTKLEKHKLAYKQKTDASEQISEDTLVIKYESKLTNAMHNQAGTLLERSVPLLGYDIVKLKKGRNLEDAVKYYSSLDHVASVTPSYTYETDAISNDPKSENMYHLSLLEIDKALSLAGDHEVTVAVIDTGIDANHPDLKSQILPPYNVGDPNHTASVDVHSTHVSGIIGAEANNGVGGYGVNPNAKILPIDVFGGIFVNDYVIAEGILYAIEQEVDVINMSLSSPFPSPILEEAVEKAIDAGIVIVTSAGNTASDGYRYPAAFDGVISVGATDMNNKLADFSSYGAYVDIVAPGVDIYNTVYDFTKQASSYAELSGTSMSSPIVAGVASLLLSKYPDLKPHEVEAILERTANDLGAEGYDLKYANGIVNPVAALQYDVNHLPQVIDWTDERVLAEATTISSAEYTQEGALTSPEEVDWFRFDLEEGQAVQTSLMGASQYDYELELRFFPEGATEATETIEINDAFLGGQEGTLYTALENGTLAIGITDANGNYNIEGKSRYELKLERFDELHDDGLTKNNIAAISELPFNSDNLENAPLTFIPEADNNEEYKADKDYFTFSVEEPEVVSISLSEVPGIDSTLNIYFADDFNREIPADVPEEELFMFEPWPFVRANTGQTGEGEVATFEAMPGIEYIIEASSEPEFDFFFYFFEGIEAPSDVLPASAVPYQLVAEVVDIPEDEDGYPMMETYEEELIEGTIDQEEYIAYKKDAIEENSIFIGSSWSEFDPDETEQIISSAIQYNIGDNIEGYIQYSGDRDFYTFTADKNAVYQFEFENTKTMMPWVELYEYDEESNELYWIAYTDFYYGSMENRKMTVALEQGKQYYVKIQNDLWQPSAEPYQMSSTTLVDVAHDANEPNDKPILATILKPGSSVSGSFILPNDVDTYYYKHRSDTEVLGISLTPNPYSEEQEQSLPQDVKGALLMEAVIVEDTNGNMMIDDSEAEKGMMLMPGFFSPDGKIQGSFKAKENVGYIIGAMNYTWDGLSVQTYDISLFEPNTDDEDSNSVVSNHVPSEPLHFTKVEGAYEAVAYLNGGVEFGDKDYYEFNVSNDAAFDVSLQVPSSIDGAVTIYDSEGDVVQEIDFYGVGDEEVATVSLQAGKYYFEVKDAASKSSKESYTLRVAFSK
ncbi:S8 family peptidase [Bacillus sp. SCS-151]|uniref:S8 family peptidase n=1 Tax=Nanhaiella sioensis TaxID=3115293 RepID=UPI00397CC0C2